MAESPNVLTPAPDAVGRRRIATHVSAPALVAALEALACAALILYLTRRLFLDASRLNQDFFNDALYISLQAEAVRDGGTPSLFLSSTIAAMYPIFAFYGGTLFAFSAVVSIVTGQSPFAAQAITYALALAASYGGWYWLARQAGVRRWLAHVPAIAYVTAPFTITNIYARQDFPEVVATAVMPLMVAAAISVARADRLRAGPVAALAAATIAFTGSHNLTLLFGTVFLVLLALVVLITIPESRRVVSRTGALRVLAVCLPAAAVNGWFLLPDLVYAHDTAITQRVEVARAMLRTSSVEFSLGRLLSPLRPGAGTGAEYALPVLVVAWALLAAGMARPAARAPWRRLVVVLLGAVLGLAVLMANTRVLAGLSSPWVLLQSPARLDTFAVFAICGMLVAALAATDARPRWMTGLLIAVLAIGGLQTARQVDNAPLGDEAAPLVADGRTTFGIGDYADATVPIVRAPVGTQTVLFQHDDFDGDRLDLKIGTPPGGLLYTNLMAPVRMLHVEGARILGRWDAGPTLPGWQHRWYLVLKVDPGGSDGQHHVVVEPARSFPIVAGRVISLLGLLGLLGLAVVIALRRARPRPRAPRPGPRPAAAP